MTYLIVGVDRHTFGPWHRHVLASDAATASAIGRRRAGAEGVALAVAAVIAAGGQVLSAPAGAVPVAA